MDGMYWDDFRRLIERSLRHWRYVRYYRSADGFHNTVSICDLSLPYRKPPLDTAEGHEKDWYRDSFVCNAGWLEGFIPLIDSPYEWDPDEQAWVVHPVRGMRSTLRQLLEAGVINKTQEVKDVLNEKV